MSRRDDRDRSRTRRRRDRSPTPARKARRREYDTTAVSVQPDDVAAQSEHQSSQFHATVAEQLPANLQTPPVTQFHHSAPCFHQYPPVNYSLPFPPEPAPTKDMKTTMVLPDNTQGRHPEPAAATSQPAPLPAQPKKSWLTPPEEWQPGEGLLDKNRLYSFTLPMTVANTPHNSQREMSGMDICDVRLVQVIHGGIFRTGCCDRLHMDDL